MPRDRWIARILLLATLGLSIAGAAQALERLRTDEDEDSLLSNPVEPIGGAVERARDRESREAATHGVALAGLDIAGCLLLLALSGSRRGLTAGAYVAFALALAGALLFLFAVSVPLAYAMGGFVFSAAALFTAGRRAAYAEAMDDDDVPRDVV